MGRIDLSTDFALVDLTDLGGQRIIQAIAKDSRGLCLASEARRRWVHRGLMIRCTSVQRRRVMSYASLQRRSVHALGRSLRLLLAMCLAVAAVTVAVPAMAAPPEQKVLASDGAAYDAFGWATAMQGDTAVVGARYDDNMGSAYVFTHSGGAWTQRAKLVSASRSVNDEFGHAVDIDGNTIVVTQSGNGGAVHVYTGAGDSWTLQQTLYPDTPDWIQHAAIDGDTILFAGNERVYVYTRSAGTWSKQAVLTSDYGAPQMFGCAVDLDGDTALIGARGGWADGWSGSAYVFTRSGGIWSQRAKLDPSVRFPGMGQSFGCSVALCGGTAVIGSNEGDLGNGSVWVFTGSGDTWAERTRIQASDGSWNDYFGAWVAFDGANIVASAFGDDGRTGCAYRFSGAGGTWTEQEIYMASDRAGWDQYAGQQGVAISGNHILIGSLCDDNERGEDAGSAYFYELEAPLVTQRYEQTAPQLAWVGAWSSVARTQLSAGSARCASGIGKSVTATFDGTGIDWIGARTTSAGKARVYLDGVLVATVDLYSNANRFGEVLYSVSGLDNGPHTLKIECFGSKNPASAGTNVWIDAFDVTGELTGGS
ncbi:MAG: hypothetical protein FDZ70_07875 [Actinobacteria bacterium]|nr:MAG: hypothetical protein FDZ70_07875 [Actinomycetota bacterium]